MIGCFVAAVIIGYFGKFLPEGVKTGITEYVLLFLKDGFLNLLNTFIGLLIYHFGKSTTPDQLDQTWVNCLNLFGVEYNA